MKGVAWKNLRLNTEECEFVYVLQVDDIKGIRESNRLRKLLDGWQQTGSAYDPTSKTESFIFKKGFNTERDWKAWARQFPYLLEEITEKTGRKKPYKLGLEYQQKTRGRKANV